MLQKAGFWVAVAGLNGLIAVGAGAYGAHGLTGEPDYLINSFNIGVQYHMWHALALAAVAWLVDRSDTSRLAIATGLAFLGGIVMFSGSLYVFGTTADIPFRGSAPAGGVLLMIGWVLFAVTGLRLTRP